MYQFTQVQFVKRKDYYDVIIYYSKNGIKFRPSTGVRVDLKHLLDSGKISAKHPNLEADLAKIKKVQDRVEKLVSDYKDKYGEKPTVSWLEKEFDKPEIDARKDLQDMFCYWNEFMAEKRATVRAESTINNYNNLEQNLRGFQRLKNYSLAFSNLDQEFFNDLVNYLLNEHEHGNSAKSEELGTRADIGLSNETVIKRLKDLVEYLKYCTVEFDVQLNLEKVKKYVKLAKHKLEVRPISPTSKWELTLTVDELQFTVNLDHYAPEFWASLSENQKRYLDIFVFMCLQGTAPIDTKAIKKTDIRAGKIIKERSKSGNEFKVELDPISEDILERHDYNMNFAEPTLNDELKKLFVTIFELYRAYYEQYNEDAYQIICTQKSKKGNRELLRIQHRGLFVELMTGRRTFLTNLAEKADEVGLKEAMSKAGHVRITTTLGYINDRQQAKKSQGNLFGIKKMDNKKAAD